MNKPPVNQRMRAAAHSSRMRRISIPESSPLAGCLPECLARARARGSCNGHQTTSAACSEIALDGTTIECPAVCSLVAESLQAATDRRTECKHGDQDVDDSNRPTGGFVAPADDVSGDAPNHSDREVQVPASVTSAAIRVWVASSDRATLDAICGGLGREPNLDVAGTCTQHLADLVACMPHGQPDVLLLDWDASSLACLESLSQVREKAPRMRVLLMVDQVSPELAEDILRLRLHGYVQPHCPHEVHARAIRAVAQDEIWVPRVLLARALAGMLERGGDRHAPLDRPAPASTSVDGCTNRERQILELVRQGHTNKEIARKLSIMEDTVKKHLQHVYDKLGVRRRTLLMLGQTRASLAHA